MRLVRLLVGIIALSGIFADAQMPRAEVADCAGVVVDDNGVPVPSAEVTLKDAAGHSYRTETDAAGRFAFHNLSSGDYQAEARKRSEEHTSELQSLAYLVCRLLLEKKKNNTTIQ